MIYFKSNQIKSKEINNRISNHQIWPPTVCDFPLKKKKTRREITRRKPQKKRNRMTEMS
jgi:hypothetical protein